MWSFFKNHGYVWETSLAGHFTYAPKGKRVKNNLENFLRKKFGYYGFEEIETPLIFKQDVWEESGHWQKFQDPVIYTQKGNCYRIDKLLEERDPDLDYSSLTTDQVAGLLVEINRERLVCPETNSDLFLVPIGYEIEYQSLMMITQSGRQTAGLRPETATATYYHFKDLLQASGGQYPINVFQIGKSFRNEISPKHNLIRGREFIQAEFQVILPPNMKSYPPPELLKLCDQVTAHVKNVTEPANINEMLTSGLYYSCLIALTYKTFLDLGLPPENIRLRQHTKDEMAFYALDAWDIEVNLKGLGWTEVAGIHDRGGYDLRSLKQKEADTEPPHILEVAIGVDRLFYSIMDNLYEEKEASQGKSTWKIPYYLAPVQVSVLPLAKNKESLVNKAQEIYQLLRNHFVTEYSDKSSIGKRYLRNAQNGIPYSITVDYDTVDEANENFNTVTVRDRDTENQVRIKIDQLPMYLFNYLTT